MVKTIPDISTPAALMFAENCKHCVYELVYVHGIMFQIAAVQALDQTPHFAAIVVVLVAHGVLAVTDLNLFVDRTAPSRHPIPY